MLIPNATYRIQLHASFNFDQLTSIIDYLHELGISTVYASPITTALPGSEHGYDTVDPLRINAEIGTVEQFEKISVLLSGHGMNWVQDIVPNHMAYINNNVWLYDALERGKDSIYYSFFDIDSDPNGELTGDKVMAPFLGKTLTECLAAGELTLDFNDVGFVIRYFHTVYPVAISLYSWIASLAGECPDGLMNYMRQLETAAKQSGVEWATVKQKILDTIKTHSEFKSFLQQRVDFVNRHPTVLAELALSQHYLLASYHLASSRINYRRFFTVNNLICLRMEDEKVFDAYHEKIYEWYQNGWIQGIRLDHIDGLAEPRRYIERLRKKFGNNCYIVAEKILADNEALPADWNLEGTTGYEFLSAVNQVMTDEAGSRKLLAFYREDILGNPALTHPRDALLSYDEEVFRTKSRFLGNSMGGERDNLVNLLYKLPELNALRFEKTHLKEALGVLMCSFPVYRIYPDGRPHSPASLAILKKTFTLAREQHPDRLAEFDFLESIFDKNEGQALEFQIRLTQFTGPLAAKGIEDTTFYVYNPYIAHNEVGDTPSIAGIAPGEFHRRMMDRLKKIPYSLSASSTHDTKRGEDARIRLNWLSSVTDEWIALVRHWRQVNLKLRGQAAGKQVPFPNDEYLIYQALLGGFPVDLVVTDEFRKRFHDYLTKALREGKSSTSWDEPNEEYEKGCHAFVTSILEFDSAFLESFIPFAYRCVHQSAACSLSQLLIKLTAPGIPDIYQGSELWENSFVDPDNRRPVDYPLRKVLLKKIKELESKSTATVLEFVKANQREGASKLYTIYRTLAIRNQLPLLFSEGHYLPIPTEGPFLSYMRQRGENWILVLVPLMRADAESDDSVSLQLPEGAPLQWTNVFTGASHRNQKGVLSFSKVWEHFPIALLTGRIS